MLTKKRFEEIALALVCFDERFAGIYTEPDFIKKNLVNASKDLSITLEESEMFAIYLIKQRFQSLAHEVSGQIFQNEYSSEELELLGSIAYKAIKHTMYTMGRIINPSTIVQQILSQSSQSKISIEESAEFALEILTFIYTSAAANITKLIDDLKLDNESKPNLKGDK